MVDMEEVRKKVLRGVYTGIGAVATGAVGNFLASEIDGSDIVVAGGEVAIGAAVSVGAEEVSGFNSSIPEEPLEFAGYGMQAVGWDEMAEALDIGIGGGSSQSRVVDVREATSETETTASQTATVVG